MSHPGNDFIIDMARDEMEDEPEISRGKVNIVFEDEPVGVNLETKIAWEEMEQLEKLFEEAVGGIIILREALNDAISVLKRNFVPLSSSPKRIDTLDELLQQDMFALLERLENVRRMHTKLKENQNEID